MLHYHRIRRKRILLDKAKLSEIVLEIKTY